MKKRVHSAEETQRTTPWQGVQLTLVQSTVCILVLLGMLLLKWIGGESYAALASQFEQAMTDDTLVSAIAPQETVAAEEPPVSVATTTTTKQPKEKIKAKSVCAPLTGGELTSPYGSREDPFDAGAQDIHNGVDIGAEEGTVLRAFKSGTVTEVGYEEQGYGHYLIVSCGSEQSYLYAHCSRVDVQVGQKVKAGDSVALVGSTGRSTGSHLHFEWREHGQAVDPTAMLPQETYV